MRRWAVLLMLLTGCEGFSLWGAPPTADAFLHVVIAQQQPQSPDLGVILEIQGNGGNYLSLAAQGGSIRYVVDGAVFPSAGACLPFDASGVQTIVVTPDRAEANLYVNLYQLDTAPNQGDGGAPGACVTSARPVVATVTPVSAPLANPTQTDGGVDGSGGAVESGGPDASDAGGD